MRLGALGQRLRCREKEGRGIHMHMGGNVDPPSLRLDKPSRKRPMKEVMSMPETWRFIRLGSELDL